MGYQKKKTEKKDKYEISDKMKSSIKKECSKFKGKDDFLMAVSAIKKVGDRCVVLSYPNDLVSKYQNKFVKKHENTLSDSFVLDEYSSESGYFIPASFWNEVINS